MVNIKAGEDMKQMLTSMLKIQYTYSSYMFQSTHTSFVGGTAAVEMKSQKTRGCAKTCKLRAVELNANCASTRERLVARPL